MITLTLLLFPLYFLSGEALQTTTPTESLYKLTVTFNSSCSLQTNYAEFCNDLSVLDYYKECSLLGPCITTDSTSFIDIQISFQQFISEIEIRQNLQAIVLDRWTDFDDFAVGDLNECETYNTCSSHAMCINKFGRYECQCTFGFTDSSDSSPIGTKCVDRCMVRSCTSNALCSESTEEDQGVTCKCQDGWTGDKCNAKLIIRSLPSWAIVLIAVAAGLAAVTGLGLCSYSIYRLCQTNRVDDDMDDSQSIQSYKPRSLIGIHEYDKLSNADSFSRASATNAAFAGLKDEDEILSVRNDGLSFGVKNLEDRLENSSDRNSGANNHIYIPAAITDRHTLSEVASQDYY